MKKSDTKLYVSKGCEGCGKNCNFRGLTVSEQKDMPKYGCNTSTQNILGG